MEAKTCLPNVTNVEDHTVERHVSYIAMPTTSVVSVASSSSQKDTITNEDSAVRDEVLLHCSIVVLPLKTLINPES